MVPSFARLDRLTMVCIQAIQETAPTQLLHSMRALNQPYSRHSRRVCSPSIRRQRANMMPLAKALKIYAATCAAIIQCSESAVNVRGFQSAMQRHSTVTPQLPNAVSSCICRGRRRALLHTSAQKTRYRSGRCSIHLIGLLNSLMKLRQRVNDWLRRLLQGGAAVRGVGVGRAVVQLRFQQY